MKVSLLACPSCNMLYFYECSKMSQFSTKRKPVMIPRQSKRIDSSTDFCSEGLEVADESDANHDEESKRYPRKKWSSTVVEAGEKMLGFKRGCSKEMWQATDESKISKGSNKQAKTELVNKKWLKLTETRIQK